MDRYKLETSELQSGKTKAWLRKKLKENNDLNLISHNQCTMQNGKVRNTLIFEEPLAGLENHLQTIDSLIVVEDEDDAVC